MKRFQIRMPEPLMEELKEIAKAKGLATSDVIRRACDKFLEEMKQKNVDKQSL